MSVLRAVVAVVLISLPSILTVVRFDRMLGRVDTRRLAAGWLRGILSAKYQLVHTIAASREPEPESWFDRQDAFFLPYANFSLRGRPGPSFSIYRRSSSAR